MRLGNSATEEQLALVSDAALDEIRKLHDLKVIVPVSPHPTLIRAECLVDTTLVHDWRFLEGQWRRRCRIVAREYSDGQTTADQYSPTSIFAAVRVLFVLVYDFQSFCDSDGRQECFPTCRSEGRDVRFASNTGPRDSLGCFVGMTTSQKAGAQMQAWNHTLDALPS